MSRDGGRDNGRGQHAAGVRDRPGRARARGGGDRGEDRQEQGQGWPTAEWVTLGISVAILLLLVGLTTWLLLAGGQRPPTIEVRPHPEAVRRDGGAYYLPVTIANRGDQAAEEIHIQLLLAPHGSADGGGRETVEFVIEVLAGGATEEVTAVFRTDPARGDVTVDGISFREP
ncbi:MAG: hypothetical protein M3Q65_02800 [Chloroflexota bacterium]|nr:hypothetical protein [Chloroflexota bacterium]